MHRIRADVEQFVDFPHYKARAARAEELEAELKKLRAAGDWALRGLEGLARDEATREGTTFEMCDYTFAKGLRAALSDHKPSFALPGDVMKILGAFKRGTPPSHKFCDCEKCVALYEACRAYPVYEVP
jgi:hypothetical protein